MRPTASASAHNGNLTNARELAEVLEREDRRHLNTSSDSEVLLNVLASSCSAWARRVSTPARHLRRGQRRVSTLPRRATPWSP